MMYDEMLTLICLSIEICVLSTEEACCPFLVSFLEFFPVEKIMLMHVKDFRMIFGL